MLQASRYAALGLLLFWLRHADLTLTDVVNRLNHFDPLSVPFANDTERFRPSFVNDYTISITYVGDYYGKPPGATVVEFDGSAALNHTEDDLVTRCPIGTVVLAVKFASVGVPGGWASRCPANYFQKSGWPRPLPLPIHVCRDFSPYTTLEILEKCHAPLSFSVTTSSCLGFGWCSHSPNTSDYNMVCPDHVLTDKSMAFSLSCGKPTLTKVTPQFVPYDPAMMMYLSGPHGNDPGSFVDVAHHHLDVLIEGTVHNVQPKFRSKRILQFFPPNISASNKNVTASLTLNYNGSSSISNNIRFTYVAPIFFQINQSTVSCLKNSTILINGDYFVNTTTLVFRLTIEDGRVYLAKAKFVSRSELLVVVPSHDVAMHLFGLVATFEVAHFQNQNTGKPYWQVVSTTSNDVSQAIRLQYYDPRLFIPAIDNYNFHLGIKSTNSLDGSWVHASEFKHVQQLGSTEICRYSRNATSSFLTDPLLEIPSDVINADANPSDGNTAGKSRLQIPGVVHCFHTERKPLKSLGGTDVMIKKYNSTRQLIWANRVGGVRNDNASVITTDLEGNVFVAGNVYGLSTLSSKVLHHGEDGFREVRLLGSQSSNRVRRMFVAKYDRGGKLIWASEVGACVRRNCDVDAIAVSPDGNVVVAGRFFGSLSLGLMCSTPKCKTSEPVSSHIVQQSNIECSLQGMESFNETCDHPIPAATMLSATTCTEPDKYQHLCNTDLFMGMLDQNGTLIWAKNVRRNQTWTRYTPLIHPFVKAFIDPWETSAMLTYRAIPEKIAASTDPDTTLYLLYDTYLDISFIYKGLKDAYHMELQSNRTRLSRATIQACVSTVNVAFARIKAGILLDAFEFGRAVRERAAYILSIPSVVDTHSQITAAAVKLEVANAQGYKDSILRFYSEDVDYSVLNRFVIIAGINAMNSRVDGLESIVSTYNIPDIMEAIIQPGLLFSRLSRTLLKYYAGRIAAMRQGWGKQILHREMQMVFLTAGSVFSDYPARPTSKEIQQGGQTLILRISSDQFMPMTDANKNLLIDNIVSTNVYETGFERKIKPYLRSPEGLATIVQTSEVSERDTITITFPELGALNYTIPDPETIIISIPQTITEYGSAYPFYAQFYVRRDPVGVLWNTDNVTGDLYARPITNDLRKRNTTMTIYIAGDTLLPLTDARKVTILDNMVPSGNDVTEPIYIFDITIKADLKKNLDRITTISNNTVLHIDVRNVELYDVLTAETITVTIPGEVTSKGFSHSIGSFIVKPLLMGSFMASTSANNLGSGGYELDFTIAGDRYRTPKSQECIADLVNEIHSPNVPFVTNGFMLKVVPMLKDVSLPPSLTGTFNRWSINFKGNTLTLLFPPSAQMGYAPYATETITFIIPASCTLSSRRHYYAPLDVYPGDGPSPLYEGEFNGPRFLPENQMKWAV